MEKQTSVSFDFQQAPRFKFPEIEPLLLECRYREAAEACLKLLETSPDNSAAWRILHEAYAGARDFPRALEAIERALALKPDNRLYRRLHAICLKENRQFEAAIAALETLHDAPHPEPAICDALKVSFFRMGDSESARKWGQIALNARVERYRPADEPPHRPLETPPSGKSVVAFSLWGSRAHYGVGAAANARLVRELMPGWTARFYVGADVPAGLLAKLEGYGAEVIRADAIPSTIPNYLWRCLVADDPGVGRFICRDTDSRISAKELAAVTEWIASPYRFHAMRDHVFHTDLILAGLWGGTTGYALDLRSRIERYHAASRFDTRYGVDQAFLREIVWPLVSSDLLNHDSYYRVGNSRPFPIGGQGTEADHVGMAVISPDELKAEAERLGLEWAFSP